MRTTISIEDELLARAKQKALERKCSLGDLVNEALLASFAHPSQPSPDTPFRLTTFNGKGTCPGVSLNDNAAILDRMDEA